jgi:hypothetical protein
MNDAAAGAGAIPGGVQVIRKEVAVMRRGRARPGLEIEHLRVAIDAAEGMMVRDGGESAGPLRVTERVTVTNRGAGRLS